MAKYVKKENINSIKLNGLDNLFGPESSDEENTKQMVPLNQLVPFKNHPFHVVENSDLEELTKSVKENGIIEPLLVRQKSASTFEIISGHRRKRAAEIAGLQEVPVAISTLDDDQATILMVDSNLHRETILPSEKAFAYKMKNEAMRHQGKKNAENTATAKLVGEGNGDSERTVHRYIQLTNLIPELLNMVDNKTISLVIGVELSSLKENEQTEILKYARNTGKMPDSGQASKLKEYSTNNQWTKTLFLEIMGEKKPVKPKIVINTKKLHEYFPENTTQEEMETIIFNLLENWKNSNQ